MTCVTQKGGAYAAPPVARLGFDRLISRYFGAVEHAHRADDLPAVKGPEPSAQPCIDLRTPCCVAPGEKGLVVGGIVSFLDSEFEL